MHPEDRRECGAISHHGGSIGVSERDRFYGGCRGGISTMELVATQGSPAPPFATLPYGSSLRLGAVICGSESAGLSCASTRTGNGFFVHRDGYEFFSG